MTKSSETYSAALGRIYEKQLQKIRASYEIYAADQKRRGKKPEPFESYSQAQISALTPTTRRS